MMDIYGAEDWVKKMNRLMADSETSSALRFRLEWKPLTEEEEQEMERDLAAGAEDR
jgi:hypothetical protein